MKVVNFATGGEVDADDLGNGTFDRSRKDLFFWYRDVIQSNGANILA
ncbi:hypothetical protein [Carnobacterium sp. PL17GRE32]|nr:hypothetical protein [Carnobacterium sp. PL17GRE32]